MRSLTLALIACLALCAPAVADDAAPAPGALAAYAAGDWGQAEALAATAEDPQVRTLAAQSVLARLMIGAYADAPRRDRREAARRAQDHARAALALDPDYAPAHLRLAAGLGYEGRYVNPLRAAMRGLPQDGRDHIEQAIALDPSDPWGPAMLGAWHLEVTRRAGAGTFGADPETGQAAYRRALAMLAESGAAEPAIPYHFALALIAADPERHGADAAALLDQAQSLRADTAFARAAQDLAGSLAAQLTADPAAAQAEAIRRLEQ